MHQEPQWQGQHRCREMPRIGLPQIRAHMLICSCAALWQLLPGSRADACTRMQGTAREAQPALLRRPPAIAWR